MIRFCLSSSSRIIFAGMFILTNNVLAGDVTIIDSRHYSNVFGEVRNFRIFLPPGYNDNPGKRYPVIYFYHGWSQRYFGSGPDSYSGFEKGDDNNGDNIANFVAGHDVIVVKPDGYNRSQGEEYYLRPYNVSPVETFRQFPVYFPELVSFIDSNYRTIADRTHRAISGLSMGGFMSFWIGGKYPQLISAIGNFCGSTEFIVGPKDFPVEYRHIDMYNNYDGINVRLNYGNEDFIRYYHRDMNRIWLKVMDNYQYKIYPAAHSTCGMGEMFSFLMSTFENPLPVPDRWNHTDVYPEFSVWGYDVSSDRDVPGFTVMEKVDKRGFRCSVRDHLPDGELLPFVRLTVTTTPVYLPDTNYSISDCDLRSGRTRIYLLKSDGNGRLKICLNGSSHEVGINMKEALPDITIARFYTDGDKIAWNEKDVMLRIALLNKGNLKAQGIRARLIPLKNLAVVVNGEADYGQIDTNRISEPESPFIFRVPSDSVEIVRFRLEVSDKAGNKWSDLFEVPIFRKDLPEIKEFEIADGKVVTVVREGIHEETTILGRGNGDGIANPGESIVMLVREDGKLWRTFLTSGSRYINPYGVNVRMSDNWGNYDHVGGSAKYSVPLISSDCPDGQIIEFIGEYWLPDYPNHIIKKGIIRMKVTGRDLTPPYMQWCRVTGNNDVQVRIVDGSTVLEVKAELVNKANPDRTLIFNLTDNGMDGDITPSDNVFSCTVPEHGFGMYTIRINAEDSDGNRMEVKAPGDFVLH